MLTWLRTIVRKRKEQLQVELYDKGFSCVLLMRFRYCCPLEEIDFRITDLTMADDYSESEWDMGARDALNLLMDIERNPKYANSP